MVIIEVTSKTHVAGKLAGAVLADGEGAVSVTPMQAMRRRPGAGTAGDQVTSKVAWNVTRSNSPYRASTEIVHVPVNGSVAPSVE